MYRNFVSVFGRFDDFDDAIDEAIEEDIRELCDGEWTIWGIKTHRSSTRSYITHPTPSLLMSKYSHKQLTSQFQAHNHIRYLQIKPCLNSQTAL